MIHPSPTALEEIRKRHDEVETNYGDEPWDENCIEDGEAAHKDRATLITHIAALEAEMAADKKIKEAVCSQLEIADFANASLALACVQDELKRLQAEAQLATRLPTRAEIEAKFGEWAMTGESTVMKARWMHEWLLSGAATAEQPSGLEQLAALQSKLRQWFPHYKDAMELIRDASADIVRCMAGAATPAPTAALTEEELLTPELIKKAADAGERVGWDDVLTPNAQIYHRAIDLKKYETALRAVLPIIIDSIAKSPPQGAEE